MTLQERLLRKVSPEPNSGCWLWTGYVGRGGYGHFNVDGKTTNAHRASYEIFKCTIPSGLDLDHLCRVRCCVNPDHLEPVTRQVNATRGVTGHASGQRQKAKTHCPKGHEYSSENTYVNPNGCRQCKACKNALTARWYSKNRDRQLQYLRDWRQRRNAAVLAK